MTRSLLALLGLGVFAVSAAAQEPAPTPAPQKPPAEEDVVKREEVVVVTASKVESTLINAPATVSVVGGEELMNAPSQNLGEVLRNVPGVNVIQMSARDYNLTSRQATSTLATSQLVLLDGRSVYLDFFGLVLWDLVPNNPQEIKQIEVVRGPASAVWGANALTGVVNIITKSPREWQGVNVNMTGGIFNRDDGSRAAQGDGNAFGGSVSISRAPNDKVAFRLSGGYYNSDPYSRPVGNVPIAQNPFDPRIRTGGAPYPIDATGTPGSSFENEGTSQPKVDLRIDQELSNGRLTYSGGYAGSKGIVHTGIGPFNLKNGSYLGYGRVGYTRGAFKAAAFVNFLDAEAPNLLLTDPTTLQPVALNFTTQTYDFELSHSRVLAGKHILTYGGNARRNNFEITLTPNAENRSEFGGYLQWEYFQDKFRLSVGGRVDKFGNIDDPVFSPRVTAMFKPTPDHAVRLSFNQAFRSPSAVNNFLDQKIFAPGQIIDLRPLIPLLRVVAPPLVPLVPTAPFPLVVRNVGNPNLKEESVTAYEVSYTGTVNGRTTLGLAVYQNDTNDNINFTNIIPSTDFPTGGPGFEIYTPANSAETGIPGPLYAFLLQARVPNFPLPRTVTTYLNLGPTRQRGVEASIDHRINDKLSAAVNYSFQDEPEILDPDSDQIRFPLGELALPAKHRFNASVNWNAKRLLGSASVHHSSEAFWSDVLSAPFHGFTDAFTMINASFGVKWSDGKVITTIKGTNLANETIQQHIFGDIIKRSIMGEVRLTF